MRDLKAELRAALKKAKATVEKVERDKTKGEENR